MRDDGVLLAEVRALRVDVDNLSRGLLSLNDAVQALADMMSEVHRACTPLPPDD